MVKGSKNIKTLFKGIKFDLVESSKWQFLKHTGGAAILPITDQNEIILVKQLRVPVGGYTLEVPAGCLDVDGEDPKDCAIRELYEETGYKANNIIGPYRIYSSPGCTNEVLHLFIATDIEYVNKVEDVNEKTEIVKLPLECDLLQLGDIMDAKTLILILLANILFERKENTHEIA